MTLLPQSVANVIAAQKGEIKRMTRPARRYQTIISLKHRIATRSKQHKGVRELQDRLKWELVSQLRSEIRQDRKRRVA